MLLPHEHPNIIIDLVNDLVTGLIFLAEKLPSWVLADHC